MHVYHWKASSALQKLKEWHWLKSDCLGHFMRGWPLYFYRGIVYLFKYIYIYIYIYNIYINIYIFFFFFLLRSLLKITFYSFIHISRKIAIITLPNHIWFLHLFCQEETCILIEVMSFVLSIANHVIMPFLHTVGSIWIKEIMSSISPYQFFLLKF